MKKLLWLRDHCKSKAAWHRKMERQWAASQNKEHAAEHAAKAAEHAKFKEHWEECAAELEAVICSR